MTRAPVMFLTLVAGLLTATASTPAIAAPTAAAPTVVAQPAATMAPVGAVAAPVAPVVVAPQMAGQAVPPAVLAGPAVAQQVVQPTWPAAGAVPAPPVVDPNVAAAPVQAASDGTPLALRNSGQPLTLAQESSSTSVLLKIGGVLVLAAVGVWFLRRRSAEDKFFQSGRSILIHTRTRVGLRSEIVWIEAGGQHLLVSLGPEGMRTLAELNDGASAVDDSDAAPTSANNNERQPERDDSVDQRFSALLARTRTEVANSRYEAPAPAPEKPKHRAHTRDDDMPVRGAEPAGYGLEGQATGLLRARRA